MRASCFAVLLMALLGLYVPQIAVAGNISASTERALRTAAGRADAVTMSAVAIEAIAVNSESLETVMAVVARAAPHMADKVSFRISAAYPRFAARIAAVTARELGREAPTAPILVAASDSLPDDPGRGQKLRALRAQNTALKEQFSRLAEKAKKLAVIAADNNRDLVQAGADVPPSEAPSAPVIAGTE